MRLPAPVTDYWKARRGGGWTRCFQEPAGGAGTGGKGQKVEGWMHQRKAQTGHLGR